MELGISAGRGGRGAAEEVLGVKWPGNARPGIEPEQRLTDTSGDKGRDGEREREREKEGEREKKGRDTERKRKGY